MLSIEQLIDRELVRKPHQGAGKFSPSKFGMCYRQQIWLRQGEPVSDPPDARNLRVMKAGSDMEAWVKRLITREGSVRIPRGLRKILTHEQAAQVINSHIPESKTGWVDTGRIPLQCEDVKGYADLVSENEVADVKAPHSGSFWWTAKKLRGVSDEMSVIRKDKYHYWLQVMYYAKVLCKKFGRLIFISRDDYSINEYVEPMAGFWEVEVDKEILTLRQLWLTGALPSAAPRCEKRKDGGYWQCDYCNYRTLCKELESKK